MGSHKLLKRVWVSVYKVPYDTSLHLCSIFFSILHSTIVYYATLDKLFLVYMHTRNIPKLLLSKYSILLSGTNYQHIAGTLLEDIIVIVSVC